MPFCAQAPRYIQPGQRVRRSRGQQPEQKNKSIDCHEGSAGDPKRVGGGGGIVEVGAGGKAAEGAGLEVEMVELGTPREGGTPLVTPEPVLSRLASSMRRNSKSLVVRSLEGYQWEAIVSIENRVAPERNANLFATSNKLIHKTLL